MTRCEAVLSLVGRCLCGYGGLAMRTTDEISGGRKSNGSSLAVLATLLLAVSSCSQQPPPRSQPSALLGDLMPPFQSQTVSGNPVISGGYSGHTVVVSFVSSSCESCERTLRAAQSMYADQRELIVVSIFGKEAHASVRSEAARLGLRFPVVVDGDGAISRRFQVNQWPSTFVIDPHGRVTWVGGSDVNEDTLSRAVAAAD